MQAEFTRQAETFLAAPTLHAAAVTTRIGEALGPDVARVLDVACGPGILLPTLRARARLVIGVDLTEKNLILARGGGDDRVHLVRARAERLPFAAGSFDAAVVRLALHHFLDPAAVLGAVRSALAPGGRLIVLDLLAPEDSGAAALRDALERLRDPSHTAFLSRPSMLAHIEGAGFRLCDEQLWSQRRQFTEWAAIINEPRRMADMELVLRALARSGGDPAGLDLREEGTDLCFTYDWGLFVAAAA